MLSVLEIHYFTRLVEEGKVKNIIKCPFGSDDIIITKVDENTNPYFYCLNCQTSFSLGKRIEKIIKITIDKFKNQR